MAKRENLYDGFTLEDVVAIIKTRLKQQPEEKEWKPTDEEIELSIEEAAHMICNYCLRFKVPSELRYVLAELATDILYNYGARTHPESFTTENTTVKVGRVEVAQTSDSSEITKLTYLISNKDMISQYLQQLDPWRRLWW